MNKHSNIIPQLWRPSGWWNPFDYFTNFNGIDILVSEDGTKMTTEDRKKFYEVYEAGADAMLDAVFRDIHKQGEGGEGMR